MKYIIFFLTLFSCNYHSGLVDLTPDDGFRSSFAFNVPALNAAISDDTAVVDTGYYAVDYLPVRVASPFELNIQYWTTDTFAFEWQDYEPVIEAIHRIANGFDITYTTVTSRYAWLNHSQMYSTPQSYLIPLFNRTGQRYWLEVFKEKQSFWMTKYTARGIWATSNPRPIKGDVS